MNPYIGHEHQISGVEEHRLVGGKGDGMRLFEITNGKGLEMTVSPTVAPPMADEMNSCTSPTVIP